MVLMRNSITHFCSKDCIVDSNRYVIVSVENNLVYLKSIDKTDSNNCLKVRVSSYTNIIKMLSILGYEIVK